VQDKDSITLKEMEFEKNDLLNMQEIKTMITSIFPKEKGKITNSGTQSHNHHTHSTKYTVSTFNS
jgi:hypothetical protein